MSTPPAGYRRVTGANGTYAVVRDAEASAVREIVATGTLHDWAARQPGRRALQGRDVAWAVALPGGTRAVVRHSRHGGALARLTGDRFVTPTRAPHELATALWLAASGVPTPAVIAYAVYPAGPLFRRADVATEEVPDARDLGAVATEGGEALERALDATLVLLRSLAAAGAHHPDLNVKNVLLAGPTDAPTAWVLDVDRVRRTPPASPAVMRANVRRLVRSLERWRERRGAPISNDQIARIAALSEER